MPYAILSDLTARWQPPSSLGSAQLTTLLGDASLLIDAECPTVEARVISGDLDPGIPLMIACAMVQRAAMNRDLPAMTQVQQTAGPFSWGGTLANPSGNLYLSKSERRLLNGATVGQRAATVDTTPPAEDSASGYGWVL